MSKSPAKVQPAAFRASIGVLLGLAILLACTRTYIRYQRFRRFFTDDLFLFLATLSLIIGTSLTYVNLPYIYTQVNIEGKIITPPVDFVQEFITEEKLLFFEACTTPQALYRQDVVVKVSTVLDILTDVMLISIPTILLWRVKIALRKKLALASVLCLSIFLIIISIIKVAAAHTIGTQVDATWVIFWLQAEAAVAVIAVSITMFRSLFLADGSRNKPQYKPRPSQPPASYRKLWTRRDTSQVDSLTVPLATYSLGTAISPRVEAHGSQDMALPMQDTNILVTRDFSMQVAKPNRGDKQS
ncbi:hypothetical protein MMC22_001114, partial [Lobaria immixta]|nr:hypothetical protein [Lobaria immixta]